VKAENLRNYSTRELKRFYKNVSISKAEGGGFEILLDKHKLRTPGGKLFVVPNEALALAVASEWDFQEKVIKRHIMHLTLLANTSIDNPMQKSKETLINGMLELLDTDTICYRLEEPTALHDLQKKEWDPLLDWLRGRYGVQLEVTTDIGVPHVPPETKNAFRQHLNSYNLWALTGYQQAVDVVKSFILATALVDRAITVEKAVELARLELEFQVAQWGNVEWHHDVDMFEMRSRLAAAAIFVHLNIAETRTVFNKQTSQMPV
jgi:ATP synthase F1 complex assembly factor 2